MHLQPRSFVHIASRAAAPFPIAHEAVVAVLQKWRAGLEARLGQHAKTGVAKLEAGVARLAGHLKAFSESSSQDEAQVVGDCEAALREVHAKVVAVTGKHGPAMAAIGADGQVAEALREADQTLHKAKMMQVGWGLAELCRRPKVTDPAKGKKIRCGLHQLYKEALEPAPTVEFISVDTLVQTARYIKMDHPKLGMLKNLQDAAARDAVLAAINEPQCWGAASSAGGGEPEKSKAKRGKGKKRARGNDGAEDDEQVMEMDVDEAEGGVD